MARKKFSSKNINWGQGMASFGSINATISLIVAWLIMFGFIGFGIYLIVQGAKGQSITGDKGMCINNPTSSTQCDIFLDESACTAAYLDCSWSKDITSGSKVLYIVIGLLCILLGIGIVMLANYVRNKARKDRNFAAVIGTGFLAEGIANAFGGGR